jgi:hypothetical protein
LIDTARVATEMATVAYCVVSAALLATTWNLPVDAGAVYMPSLVIVPPEASMTFQTIFRLTFPVTVAVNCWVVPGSKSPKLGEIVTVIQLTDTSAIADLLGSAALVATTWYEPPT